MVVNEVGQVVVQTQEDFLSKCTTVPDPYGWRPFLYDHGLVIPISVPGAWGTDVVRMNNFEIYLVGLDGFFGNQTGYLYDIKIGSLSAAQDCYPRNSLGQRLCESCTYGYPNPNCVYWLYQDGKYGTVTYVYDTNSYKLYESGQVYGAGNNLLLTRCAP